MIFIYSIVRLILIIAKYRLRQELFKYGTVYNRIVFAMFFFMLLFSFTRCKQNFGANLMHKQVIEKKENSANVEASPPGNLIITK